jgi:hypothetical protein
MLSLSRLFGARSVRRKKATSAGPYLIQEPAALPDDIIASDEALNGIRR